MPSFFNDGNTPHRSDGMWKIEQKILGALIDGGGGGGANNKAGVGSPVGVVTPDYVGQYYLDTTNPYNTWFSTGLTNVDWVLNTGGITP